MRVFSLCAGFVRGAARDWGAWVMAAVVLIAGPAASAHASALVPEGSPFEAYRAELYDLHVARDFRAQKNSYILGLEVRSNRPKQLEKGDRKVLLDVEGQGSLRHIWETHAFYWQSGAEAPEYTLEFYVDGEETPSIHGPIIDLVKAAKACEQPFVEVGGSLVNHRSQNFYLPVPFDESLRVEIVADDVARLIFMQWDYRIDDDSMEGVRLRQEGEGDAMRLFYTGPAEEAAPVRRLPETERRRFQFAGNNRIELDGPGIIRRLAVNNAPAGARLRVYYDGAESAAVDVDMADFFGPFRGVVLNNNAAYFPMPFREQAIIEIDGERPQTEWTIEADVEPVEAFDPAWRYFHAKHHRAEEPTLGWDNHPVLYTRGRGHWIGMALYDTGHDHGGGDFAVVDGETAGPDFIHGINGEDYFSFAFFGMGENFPYTEAYTNEAGRMRVHLENPYPFEESLEVSWGALRGLHVRSVTYWYQDSPEDRTEPGQRAPGLTWSVFGPVDAPMIDDGFTPDVSSAEALFAPLPPAEALGAGESFEATHTIFETQHTGTFDGWKEQEAAGPHLNLMYIYRHVMDLGEHSQMGYYARLMMAQTELTADADQDVTFQLSYDDPIEVVLNGEPIHTDLALRRGFTTENIAATLREGRNTLLVRMADTPNINACWAAISLRILGEDGREISGELQTLGGEGSN